ncbi:MAG: hypothetical protein AAF193_11455, partial [Bacteroidota bacterium]
MKKTLVPLLAIGICTVVLFGCQVDDVTVEDWNPIAAVPLASTNFDIYDVFERSDTLESLFVVDEEGLMALEYEGSLFSFGLDEILDLPDQSISQSVSFSSTDAELIDTGVGIGSSLDFDTPLETDPEDIRIDEVKMMGGQVIFNYTVLQNENFEGNLTIDNIFDTQGNPLVFDIDNEGAAPGQPIQEVFDLTGASIAPVFEDPDNVLSISFSFNVTNNSEHTASEGEALDIQIQLIEPEIDYITGYFGQIPINTDQDSVRIRIFDNGLTGTFRLEEAFIDLNIVNSFGLPVAFDLDEITSINIDSGDETPLNFPDDLGLDGQETLNGMPEETTISFNNDNTNIVEVLEPSPKTIYFSLNATGNPDG